MGLWFPTRALIVALVVVAPSLEHILPEVCPQSMEEVQHALGTMEEGNARARIFDNRDGSYVTVPVHQCVSACNVKAELQTHIIAQRRPRDALEENHDPGTPETVTVSLEDSCSRVNQAHPGGNVNPRNVSILLVLFMWSGNPVEYRLHYEENSGIHIWGVYLVQPGGKSTPGGGPQETVASTLKLPDHHSRHFNVFNVTFNDDFISRADIPTGASSQRIFTQGVLSHLLKDMEEQSLLVSDTLSTVSFTDYATDWLLNIGCCDSAKLEEFPNKDNVHVPHTAQSPAADGNHIYRIVGPVIPLALFVFSAAVYTVAIVCCHATKKMNSTVQPVDEVIIDPHIQPLWYPGKY